MLFNRKKQIPQNGESEHTFPFRQDPFHVRVKRRILLWISDRQPLFEASCVAVSAHILAFPIIWFMGWALPWPKSPVIVTVIEINLENWPEEAIPTKVTDIYKSHMYPKKKK